MYTQLSLSLSLYISPATTSTCQKGGRVEGRSEEGQSAWCGGWFLWLEHFGQTYIENRSWKCLRGCRSWWLEGKNGTATNVELVLRKNCLFACTRAQYFVACFFLLPWASCVQQKPYCICCIVYPATPQKRFRFTIFGFLGFLYFVDSRFHLLPI